MEAGNYRDLSIPQLRQQVVNRNIIIGTARTKEELIALLERDDQLAAARAATARTAVVPGLVTPPRIPAQPTVQQVPTVQPLTAQETAFARQDRERYAPQTERQLEDEMRRRRLPLLAPWQGAGVKQFLVKALVDDDIRRQRAQAQTAPPQPVVLPQPSPPPITTQPIAVQQAAAEAERVARANYEQLSYRQLEQLFIRRQILPPLPFTRQTAITALLEQGARERAALAAQAQAAFRPVPVTTVVPPAVVTPPRMPAVPVVAPTAPRPVRTVARTGTVPSPPRSPVRGIPTVPVIPAVPVTTVRPVVPPVVAPATRPVVPPATRPVVPPATRPIVPPATRPVVPPAARPVIPIPVTRPVIPPPAVRPVIRQPFLPPPSPSPETSPETSPEGSPIVPVPFPNVGRPTIPPVRGLVVQPPPLTLEQSVRQKLQGATFEVYDTQLRGNYPRTIGVVTDINAEVLNDAQRIRFGTQQDRERLYIVQALMTLAAPQQIATLATELGFSQLNASIDVYYNLFWYLNMGQNPYALNLTNDEKAYISGLTRDQLLALLGPRYRGPTDMAALLFAAVSGKAAAQPDQSNIPRYPEVAAYAPDSVWTLAQDLYGLINVDDQYASIYPPYVHVALQPPSRLETIIGVVTEANVDQLIAQFGLTLPTENTPQTAKQKMKFFFSQIRNYEMIFTRPDALLPPPILTQQTEEQATAALEQYTLKEIIDTYEPTQAWADRDQLIRNIWNEGRGGAVWAWRRKWCNNDETFNVLEGDRHGDINKNNPQDPTLSYGFPRNYRCYQTTELVASWGEDPNYPDEHIFHFRVPDWTKGAIDPNTGQPMTQDFPVDSIRQLRTLLQTPPAGYNVRPLTAKVTEGLDAAANAGRIVRALKTQYEAKQPDEQYLIRLYLAWLFTYGMWMRFWKGPGNAWPARWVEGGGGDLCETGRRDEHIFIQHAIRTALAHAYEQAQYPGLKAWIEGLPLIDYNFRTGEAHMATAGATTLKTILDRIQLGDFCMAHGSDLILKTAYYLTARIMNLATEGQFNAFINEMFPGLYEIERQVVEYELHAVRDRQRATREKATREHKTYAEDKATRDRIEALEARQRELARPAPVQPPFRPTELTGTQHTDPGLGAQIRFAD